MNHTYTSHKQAEKAVPEKETAELQGPSMAALRSGAAAPTPNQKGNPVDLPNAMRAKMESAFGADLSAVKLYESQAVADAGAKAITQGSEIAFAPGMLDFTSFGGQALLGHEISHVVSQARGDVTGGGFLNDHALEARADREGAMAAAGEQIAMPTAAMSTVTAAAAAGPMQAKDKDQEETPGSPENIVVLPEGQPGDETVDPRGSLNFPEMDKKSFNAGTMNWQMKHVAQHLQDHDQKINVLQNQVAQMQMNGPSMGMDMSMMGMGMGMPMQMPMMDMGMQMPMMDMSMGPQDGDGTQPAHSGQAQAKAAAAAQEQGTVPPMPMRANDEEYAGDIDSLAQSTEKFDAQPLSQTTKPRRRRSSLIGRGRSGSIS